MFYHAFNGYFQHAFPLDELRPLTCTGEDSLGGYALTLVRQWILPVFCTIFRKHLCVFFDFLIGFT